MRLQPLGCRLKTLSSVAAKAINQLTPERLTCFAAGTLLKIFIFRPIQIARALSESQRALSRSSLAGVGLAKLEPGAKYSGSVEAILCRRWHSQDYSASTIAWSLQSR